MYLFNAESGPLRADIRFATLAARLGLAQYWMTSGRWPDCAAEVPYDFKTACRAAVDALAR